MAEITDTGIQRTELGAYVTEFEQSFRDALGADLSLDSATPQGQLIGALALVATQIDELAVHVANGLSIHTAVGRQISDYSALFNLPLIAGERSTVTATLTGVPATVIPRGTRARTTAGAVFATDAQVTIGASGSVDVLMRASVTGPVVAGAGELTRILDAVAGWTGITNTLAAVLGRNRETDSEYRTRYSGEIASHARDAIESIRARVLAAPNVTACLVRDNDTAASVTTQSIAIAARSILVIAQGGADADIAAAIKATKPAGAPTVGNRSVAVSNANGGPDITIRFRKVDPIPISVAVTTAAGPTFPSTGFETMRRNLLQWFAGEWPVPGPGIFDQSGVGIGETIDLNRLNTPLNAVPGHELETVTVERVAGLVASIEVTDGGSGYTSAPDVAFSGGAGSGAEAVAVIEGGAVVRVDITNRGSGYTSVPTVAFSGGGGSGAAATAAISTATLGTPDLDQRYTLASGSITFALSTP